MEYSMVNLEHIINLFYCSHGEEQSKSHDWLTEAQNSTEAWTFLWELLSPNKQLETQFFGATTLHIKLTKHFNQIPQSEYTTLKDRLIECILLYKYHSKLILNRLCISLTTFILKTLHWYGPTIINEIIETLEKQCSTRDDIQYINLLLEILIVLPEESVSLLTINRISARNILYGVSLKVLNIVEVILNPTLEYNAQNLYLYLNAIRCITSWIRIGGLTIENCTSLIRTLIQLISYVYWYKSRNTNETLSTTELELCETAIEGLLGLTTHPQSTNYEKYIVKYGAEMLYEFEKILNHSGSSGHDDFVVLLYNLLINVVDVHSSTFVKLLKSQKMEEKQIVFDYLTMVLRCNDLPGMYPIDETSSSLTFGFWYTLQDDILSLKTPECAHLLLTIKPYYRNLVYVLLRKSMYPLNDEWSNEDMETLRCYRQDIADTFIYCYNVLNLEMLDIIQSKLMETLQQKVDYFKWNEVEACLHAFKAICSTIETDNLYIPNLLNLIKNIPFGSMDSKVFIAALNTIGALAEWISEHPEVLSNILSVVLMALNDHPEIGTSATMALKDITYNCQKNLNPYAESILNASQKSLHSGNLMLPESVRLMFSIGYTASTLNFNQLSNHLNVILAPYFSELEPLTFNQQSNLLMRAQLITIFKLLSALFSALIMKNLPQNQQQPTVLLMEKIAPLLDIASQKYCTDSEAIEELCQLFKSVLTTLLDSCGVLLAHINKIILQVYSECPHSTIFTVLKPMILIFYDKDGYKELIYVTLNTIVNRTMKMCLDLQSNSELLQCKTDIVEQFFLLLIQIYKKTSQIIIPSNLDLTNLFKCATMCLSFPELSTLKVCTNFLVQYVYNNEETHVKIVKTCGEELILKLLILLDSCSLGTHIDILSDLVLALNKTHCDYLTMWLHNLLLGSNSGFTGRLSVDYQKGFVRSIVKEKNNKQKLSDILKEFSLVCRGVISDQKPILS